MSGSKAMLHDATRQLQDRWTQTRAQWLDGKAAAFEEQYITPLAADMHQALRIIEEIEKLLHQIHAECE